MKKCIAIIILSLISYSLSAQEIKVMVVSNGIPVEYAYVFINNSYCGYTDSTGLINIGQSAISVGDSISASYIGMDRSAVVYSSQDNTSNTITLTLTPNLQIDEVVVIAKDKSEELLKRYAKVRWTETSFMQYRGDYDIQSHNNNSIKGSFIYANLPEVYAAYYKLKPLEIISTSDTTNLDSTIRRVIKTATNVSLASVQLKRVYASTQEVIVKYMGKDNGCYVFSIIRPSFLTLLGREDGFQSIIYVNEKSGEIMRAETTMIYASGAFVELSANYADWKPKNTLGGHLIYPLKIKGTISDKNNKIEFLIDNNKISLIKPTPIPRKDR